MILYNNISDRRVINKSLSVIGETENIIKHALSNVNPFVILDTNYECNYCFMNGKYYYITSIENDTGHRYKYNLKCDVLMSYKSEIKNSLAIVNRRADHDATNRYLNDERAYIMQNRCTTEIKPYSEGFLDNGKYILVTVG